MISIPRPPGWRSWDPQEALERCPETGRPLTAILKGGVRAEYQRHRFDCMRCALATLAGVRYEEVPDCGTPDVSATVLTQAVADLGAWAHGLGCRLTWHDEPPVGRTKWIGAVPADGYGPSHCVVMIMVHTFHDPAALFPLPPGHVPCHVTLEDIKSGLTLDRLADR